MEGLHCRTLKTSYQVLPVSYSVSLSLGCKSYRGGRHLVPVIMTDENQVLYTQTRCISKPQRKELGLDQEDLG